MTQPETPTPRRLVVGTPHKITDHAGPRWECFIGEMDDDNAPFRAYGITPAECEANAKWLVEASAATARAAELEGALRLVELELKIHASFPAYDQFTRDEFKKPLAIVSAALAKSALPSPTGTKEGA